MAIGAASFDADAAARARVPRVGLLHGGSRGGRRLVQVARHREPRGVVERYIAFASAERFERSESLEVVPVHTISACFAHDNALCYRIPFSQRYRGVSGRPVELESM